MYASNAGQVAPIGTYYGLVHCSRTYMYIHLRTTRQSWSAVRSRALQRELAYPWGSLDSIPTHAVEGNPMGTSRGAIVALDSIPRVLLIGNLRYIANRDCEQCMVTRGAIWRTYIAWYITLHDTLQKNWYVKNTKLRQVLRLKERGTVVVRAPDVEHACGVRTRVGSALLVQGRQ